MGMKNFDENFKNLKENLKGKTLWKLGRSRLMLKKCSKTLNTRSYINVTLQRLSRWHYQQLEKCNSPTAKPLELKM